MSTSTVVVDLDVDFHNEDGTGYIWEWLSEARDPSVVVPGAVIVVADGDALAMARVIDLSSHENGTIVHVDLLPVTVDAYLDSAARIARSAGSRKGL